MGNGIPTSTLYFLLLHDVKELGSDTLIVLQILSLKLIHGQVC